MPDVPAPPPQAETLPPLPEPTGPPRATLMLVRPRLLFVYWVKDTSVEKALSAATQPPELRLEFSEDGQAFQEETRMSFDSRGASSYLTNRRTGCSVRVLLGLRDGDAFRVLLTSNVVRVPREVAPVSPAVSGATGALRTPRGRRADPPQPTDGPGFRPTVVATSPGAGVAWAGGPDLRPAARAGVPPVPIGDVCVVLHSHLPFVRHPEREFFLEESWLFEALTETYLPLLDMLDHLADDDVPARVTLSLSPTLLAMLRDPLLLRKYERHLERTLRLADLEVSRTRDDADFGPVAGFYRDRLERLRHLFSRTYGRDVVARFARLETEGRIEIVTCAATHALLPHIAVSEECVRAQIAVGVREHARQIGRPPRGIWLPECAYYEGLDRLLAEAGLSYFFTDAHAFRLASSPARFDVHAPILCPSGVAAFGRDEECSAQVWSAELGYPGDPAYRDFYRDIGYDLDHEYVAPFLDPAGQRGMTGLKYHRITGRADRKEPYRREWALRTLDRHADDFVRNRRLQCEHLASTLDRRPLLLAMYDSELFGHWWFEGPEWLEAILRRLPAGGLRAITPSLCLEENGRLQVSEPSTSSWGEGGYFDVWLGESNDWIYPPLHDAGLRMARLARRFESPGDLERRALAQAGRELLLAQASDWPFILRNRTSIAYARRRIHEHLHRFDTLAKQLDEGRVEVTFLSLLESKDNLFPSLDYRVWRTG